MCSAQNILVLKNLFKAMYTKPNLDLACDRLCHLHKTIGMLDF